ncbi:hypothetical protein BDZ89DRAFT_96774 [Hymenopellis radicata]|nr:hypothetical protein BDZ89DRAFT_96774 [Hymenopellis radicata]
MVRQFAELGRIRFVIDRHVLGQGDSIPKRIVRLVVRMVYVVPLYCLIVLLLAIALGFLFVRMAGLLIKAYFTWTRIEIRKRKHSAMVKLAADELRQLRMQGGEEREQEMARALAKMDALDEFSDVYIDVDRQLRQMVHDTLGMPRMIWQQLEAARVRATQTANAQPT